MKLLYGALLLLLSVPTVYAAPVCGEGLDEDIAQKICPYIEELKSSSAPNDHRLASELEKSIEWSKAAPYDALSAGKLVPNFISDLLGHNGWQKGTHEGTQIPLQSYFFKPLAQDVASLDLKNGFGRSENLSNLDTVCKYTEPKKGNGTRPGIKVNCDGLKLKVKFAEIHTQPLATRIFWALGFNADPADYHSGLKIKYDRKIFEEFNSRVGVPLKIRIFRQEIKVATLNPHYDGMKYMQSAVLKNGSPVDSITLKNKFLSEEDADIDYVITKPVQLQYSKVKGRTEVGPWSFSDFDHADSQVLRSVAVLSAWLGIYDIRRDNNLLVVDEQNGQRQIKFLFPDLGSGLGRSRYRVSLLDNIEKPGSFKAKITRRGKIAGVQVNENNNAFIAATAADFAFGVKLINQFSEAQIRELLSVSGFSGTDLDAYTEKLISRRASLNAVY